MGNSSGEMDCPKGILDMIFFGKHEMLILLEKDVEGYKLTQNADVEDKTHLDFGSSPRFRQPDDIVICEC